MNTKKSNHIEYEKFTQTLYQALLKEDGFEDVEVIHNSRLQGKSGEFHQIDVHWKICVAGINHLVCVECKNWNHPIKKNEILAFKGVIDDLSAKGIYITKSGYQSGAIKTAEHHNIDIVTGSFERKQENAFLQIEFPQFHDLSIDFDHPKQGIFHYGGNATPQPNDLPIYNSKGELIGTLDEVLDQLPKTSDGEYEHNIEDYFFLSPTGLVKIHKISYRYLSNPLLPTPLAGSYEFIEAVVKEINGLIKHQKNLYNLDDLTNC
jgi:hypothetical protein